MRLCEASQFEGLGEFLRGNLLPTWTTVNRLFVSLVNTDLWPASNFKAVNALDMSGLWQQSCFFGGQDQDVLEPKIRQMPDFCHFSHPLRN